MRKVRHLATGLALALLIGAGAAAPALAADNVTVQLDWVVRGDHAMFFVAKDKGYFAKNGINVTAIRRGTGSTTTVQQVGNGGADFGFADLPTLMVGRSQGVPVTAIAAVNQKSPMAVISVKSRKPITKPADLKGMNIGVQASGSTYVFLLPGSTNGVKLGVDKILVPQLDHRQKPCNFVMLLPRIRNEPSGRQV